MIISYPHFIVVSSKRHLNFSPTPALTYFHDLIIARVYVLTYPSFLEAGNLQQKAKIKLKIVGERKCDYSWDVDIIFCWPYKTPWDILIAK
jgi:hypothetical protein